MKVEPKKTCWLCNHIQFCSLQLFSAKRSEATTLCDLGYWKVILGSSTSEEYKDCLQTAETCKDFKS